MNRVILAAATAVAIGVLTGGAYIVTSSGAESRVLNEVTTRTQKAQELLFQNSSLEGLALLKRAESTARAREFVDSVGVDGEWNADSATSGFNRFVAKGKANGEPEPDLFIVVDAQARLVAQKGVRSPVEDDFKRDGKPKFRAIEVALESRTSISEVWEYRGRSLLKVGVAPIINTEGETSVVVGALILGYAMTADEAARQQAMLGADVAYFYGDKVYASSFRKGMGEDTSKQQGIAGPLAEKGLAKIALKQRMTDHPVDFELAGEWFMATAGRLERFSSKKLPDDYPALQAGAVVLKSVTYELSQTRGAQMTILLLGIGAIIIALLAIVLVARGFLGPLDHVEVGVNEIINGNLDHVFEPVGKDFDGLANSLNVMLARLLGRPEPGEEEYDEDGNVIMPSPLHFDTEGLSTREAEVVALAQEPDADYYNRVYNEYVQARRQVGESVEGVSFDSFVAKLRLNEANLQRRFDCRAVRFKIVVQEGSVTLKPIPIA